jgi:hypothetical protein
MLSKKDKYTKYSWTLWELWRVLAFVPTKSGREGAFSLSAFYLFPPNLCR